MRWTLTSESDWVSWTQSDVMRSRTWTVILPLALIAALGQNGKPRTGEESPPAQRGEVHVFVDSAPLRSFQKLCEESDAIVEGVVESAAARIISGRGQRVETDLWVGITRVLKGPAMPKIVVAEDGGTFGELRMITNYPPMQLNARYILFLWKDVRRGIPAVEDLPRYRIYNIAFGKYPVENDKIRVTKGGFTKYDGLDVAAFYSEIASWVKR